MERYLTNWSSTSPRFICRHGRKHSVINRRPLGDTALTAKPGRTRGGLVRLPVFNEGWVPNRPLWDPLLQFLCDGLMD